MAQQCPNQQDNAKRCTCGSADCPRKGKCCECVAYHAAAGNLPMCLRK